VEDGGPENGRVRRVAFSQNTTRNTIGIIAVPWDRNVHSISLLSVYSKDLVVYCSVLGVDLKMIMDNTTPHSIG
jgi:hypothetical protein